MKMKPVEQIPFGLYLWQMPDGSLVCDEERRYLSIPAERGDLQRVKKLKAVARECGIVGGHAIFFPGHTKVSDEEYQNQKERLRQGLIPDPLDVGAFEDEELGRKND